MSFSQENRWAQITTGAGKDVFRLREMWGTERLSELFHFDLELESDSADVDFSKVVGEPCTVKVTFPEKKTRVFHGLVTRLRVGATDPGVTRYRAELRPWLWMLTRISDCCVFQEMSVPDIVQKIFKDAGYNDFKLSLKSSYTAREYCVQYRETAFDFVSRLLEEEGIHYFFEHTDGKHTMVLADDASAWSACPSLSKMRFRGTLSETPEVDVVPQCELEQRVTTDKIALDDFSFETPSTDLEAATGSGKLERYDYPGGFLKKADGDSRAKLRLEAHEGEEEQLTGASYNPDFSAGCTFDLEDHPRSAVNATWALREVEHRLSQLAYSNHFVAGPKDTTFRPRPTTPKPVIPGTQTAIVVGKSGEEIWTDKFGRIKVHFHWDRVGKKDETSSCWIRVSQGWAGKSWGSFFLPRIGQEVVVSFLEGDPDRPLVTGAVYNAEQTVPYTLPTNQTQSTVKSNTSKGGAGFNEIRFEDKKDSEEIFVHAAKDMNTEVLNDASLTVTQNRKITVSEGDETHTVAKGKRTLSVKGDEKHTNEANYTQEVKGDFTREVKGDFKLKVTGKITIEAGGDVTLKSTGGKVTVEASTAGCFEAGTAMTVKAGTALNAEAGTALTNKAGTSLTNQAGTSLTNKGGTTLTNEGGISTTNKGSASQTVDGGGMLTAKGGLVKIN